MKILQLCPYDISVPGGVQTHVLELAKALKSKGHQVCVCTPEPRGDLDLEDEWPECYYLPASKRYKLWGTSIDVSYLNSSERSKLLQWINNEQFDVIHFHTIWNPFFQYQLFKTLPVETKKVGTFHDTPPDRGVGKWIGAPLMKGAVRYFFPGLNQIVSVSLSQAAAMGYEGTLPANMHVIPNGVALPQSDDSIIHETKAKDAFNFLFIGRLEARKGFMDLLKAYRECCQSELPLPIRLHVIGKGPLLEDVQNYMTKHSLPNIELLGELTNKEKSQRMYEADVLIAPSIYGESFGIVLLEAMIHKLKLIGYANKGYLTLGRKYDEGCFVPPGDYLALAGLMKQQVLDPQKFESLVHKGYGLAQEYTWDRISERILEVYHR